MLFHDAGQSIFLKGHHQLKVLLLSELSHEDMYGDRDLQIHSLMVDGLQTDPLCDPSRYLPTFIFFFIYLIEIEEEEEVKLYLVKSL